MEINLKNFIIFSLILCQSVFAVPSLINYQGRLTDPNGDALTGNKIMSVSIYDAATEGTSLYTEEVGIISLDSNGIYSFSFGTNQTALTSALQTTGEHWLELTVDGTSQTPRERILSVPFAQYSKKSESSEKINFKSYENKNAGEIYFTETSGFIFAESISSEQNFNCSVLIGSSENNLEQISNQAGGNVYYSNTHQTSVTVPVPANHFWQAIGFSSVKFIPIGY